MHRYCCSGRDGNLRRAGTLLVHAAVLAMILAMALPARADERAVKSKVAPVYPAIARRMKIEGDVHLIATVDAKGKVTDVKEVSGNHILALAAEDAVREWRFVRGPATSSVDVWIDFKLGQ
jgi:protein TonB